MNDSFAPDIEQAIQQSLQAIAEQMGQAIDASHAKRLYSDASELLAHIPHEPLTLAHVAGILLVHELQTVPAEEAEWFASQVQQCASDEDVEELIESLHRTDAL
jgi:hypothetical protein